MEEADFKHLHKAADTYVNTTKLNISQSSWIKITKKEPARVLMRKSFSDISPWICTNILRTGRLQADLASMDFQPLECKNRISNEKKTDLQRMVPYLPTEHRELYLNLTQ